MVGVFSVDGVTGDINAGWCAHASWHGPLIVSKKINPCTTELMNFLKENCNENSQK